MKVTKSIFVGLALVILSLNHLSLGYCHCFETIFFSDCGCHSDRSDGCNDSEHEECCHDGHEHHCPCPEDGDCSTYFELLLDEFVEQGAVEIASPIVDNDYRALSDHQIFPKLPVLLHSRWFDANAPLWVLYPVKFGFAFF